MQDIEIINKKLIMPEELTPRQRELLHAIQYNIKANGFPPTVRELQRQGFGSPGNVHQLLTHLEKKGYIFRKKRGGSRAFEVLADSDKHADKSRIVPILGEIEIAQSGVVAKTISDEFSLDVKITGDNDVFAIRVKDHNMQDAGIQKNDVVIIERMTAVDNGTLAVLSLNGRLMMKRVFAEIERFLLQSENPQYQPIYADADDSSFIIVGKVRAVIRTYSFSSNSHDAGAS